MGLQGPKTADWFERAKDVLVAGVSSGFRYWGDDDTIVVDRGEGAHVYDMDGNRYIDYQLGFGPVILGHGHPAVAEAVAAAAADGVTFAMTQRREIEAAEKVRSALGWADALRFTNSGSEATQHAIRLARAHTGRELVVKFEGAYHGAYDYVLFSTAGAPLSGLGNRRSPVPYQTSSGVPESIRGLLRTIPFNDLDAAERLFRSEGGRIAAMIVEPALGNAFSIMPADGYLQGLLDLCNEYGIVFIMDEVKTGFRFGLGGAAEYFGVTPHVATYAKSLGNGFPVAAIAGQRDVIGAWAEGGVMQAGTYSGNGLAAAAASATIDVLASGEPYDVITHVGTRLMEGFAKSAASRGVALQVVGHPSMFGLFFGDEKPTEFRHKGGHDEELYYRLVRHMISRGVLAVDEALEPFFISSAHTDADVDTTLEAFDEALATV